MVAEEKMGKKKDFFFLFGTQSKARAGWLTWHRLVRATPWADFVFITAQLWSTISTVFLRVNNFAFNYYLRPRFWDYCQIFKTTGLFLLNHAGLFPFSLSQKLWDTCISEYLHKDSNLEVSMNREIYSWVDTSPISQWPSRPIRDEITTTILQSWFATIPSVYFDITR